MRKIKKFPGQKDNEEIKLVIHKHWIMDFSISIYFFMFTAVPIIIYAILAIEFWPEKISNIHVISLFAFSIYLMVVALLSYIEWLNQELDLIIVTNERIINHDQIDFLNRSVSESPISQIEDVKGSEKGLISHIFHYGTIEIQTASQKSVFISNFVETPINNARIILDLRDSFLNKHPLNRPSIHSDA